MFACLQHFNLLYCESFMIWDKTMWVLFVLHEHGVVQHWRHQRWAQCWTAPTLHSLFIVLWKFQETKQSLYYVYYIYYTYREINIMGLCSNGDVLCYLDRWGAQRRGTPPCRAAWRGRWRGRCSPWPPAPCAAAPCSAAPRPRNRARYLHNNKVLHRVLGLFCTDLSIFCSNHVAVI